MALKLSMQLDKHCSDLQLYLGSWTLTLKTALQSLPARALSTCFQTFSVHVIKNRQATDRSTLPYLQTPLKAERTHLSQRVNTISQTSSEIIGIPTASSTQLQDVVHFSLAGFFLHRFVETFFANLNMSSLPKFVRRDASCMVKTPAWMDFLLKLSAHQATFAPQLFPLGWSTECKRCKLHHLHQWPTPYSPSVDHRLKSAVPSP